jgi:DNA-binding beta-propeller fold protein YncE
MINLNGVVKRSIGLQAVYKILFALTGLIIILFGMLYLTGTDITVGTEAPAGAQHPQAPIFSHYIYGGFGDSALNKPMFATFGNSRIYVSDTNNHRVQIFTESGDTVLKFGSRGNGDGQFFFPYGIVIGPDDSVYVADLYRHEIQVFNQDGEFLRYFGEGTGADIYLDGPAMMYLDNYGRLFVANVNKNNVAVFDLEEETLLQNIGVEGDVTAPNGVTVDGNGYIYVVDTAGDRVVVYAPDGSRPVRVINGSEDGRGQSIMINPRGIGIRNNTIYVVSNLSHILMGFDMSGNQLFTQGRKGNQHNQFMHPNGLFVDGRGRTLITDTISGRVAVYR